MSLLCCLAPHRGGARHTFLISLDPNPPYEYTAKAHGLVFRRRLPARRQGQDRRAWGSRGTGRAGAQSLEALAEQGARATPAEDDDLRRGAIAADLVRVWDVVSARLGRAPSTLLGVSLLGYPNQLVEIEAVATVES